MRNLADYFLCPGVHVLQFEQDRQRDCPKFLGIVRRPQRTAKEKAGRLVASRLAGLDGLRRQRVLFGSEFEDGCVHASFTPPAKNRDHNEKRPSPKVQKEAKGNPAPCEMFDLRGV